MDKLVTLKIGPGTLETGLSVILQMGEDGSPPTVELTGCLPPAIELEQTLKRWQITYRRLVVPYRLGPVEGDVSQNLSRAEECSAVAQNLSDRFNRWLKAESFSPLHDKLLEQLSPQDHIRMIVQTQLETVKHLPWHTWAMCDRYPNAEIALSAPAYEAVPPQSVNRQQVRILVVVGHSEGLNTHIDQNRLNHLPNADVQCLMQPDRYQLHTYLWDAKGWDIFFFAGHSTSQVYSQTQSRGKLSLNATERLTIPDLKHGLKKAIGRGLKIAFFNSCDGLGLAQSLSDLHIPQVLVMREPIPDPVAHEFLNAFLDAFAREEPFYLAVREAREKLQGLEDCYPCATWLPIIYQNPAARPPTWSTLHVSPQKPVPQNPGLQKQATGMQSILPDALSPDPSHNFSKKQTPSWPTPVGWQGILGISLISLASTALTLGLQQMGWLQGWNLRVLDQLMHLRPHELPDARILVVTVTEADIQAQASEQRQGSLSDSALLQILKTLKPMEPRVIGLDIYRDFPVSPDYPQLIEHLQSTDALFATCKVGSENQDPGISPPVEVPDKRIGFSDFVTDSDGILRRQLLAFTPDPASDCQVSYALNTLLAMNYLVQEGIEPTVTAEGYLQLEDIILRPLNANAGGYQGMDAGGHQILLNYRSLAAPEQIADQVTLSDVLEGEVNAEAVRDRIILIGTTARSFGDYWLTPYSYGQSGERETAGVLMQAHMVSQLLSAVLDDRPLLRVLPGWADSLWILSWAVLGSGAMYGLWLGIGTRRHSHQSLLWLFLSGVVGVEFSVLGACWFVVTKIGYWVPGGGGAIAIALSMTSVYVYVQYRSLHHQRLVN